MSTIHSQLLSDCRYLHATAPLRNKNNNNNNRNRTPTSTPTSNKKNTIAPTAIDGTVSFDDLAERLAQSSPAARVAKKRATRAIAELKEVDEENEAQEEEEDSEETEKLTEKVLTEEVGMHKLEKEKKALFKKLQRKGYWDDNEVRAAIDSNNVEAIDRYLESIAEGVAARQADKELTEEEKEALSKVVERRVQEFVQASPEVQGQRNQKYAVGKYQLSIEDVDEDVIKRQKEEQTEMVVATDDVRARKQEEIVADEDPNLVSILLDRPSQADKKIAEAKGQELFEFSDPSKLAQFEQAQGKTGQKRAGRGPKIEKNEHGAEQLTLVHDDKRPLDHGVLRFRDPIKQLKYFPIYPAKVKNWVTYMKACKGRYNVLGYWKNDPLLQEEEDELKEKLKIRAREKGDNISQMVDKRKRQTLSLDLEGHYRFGVQPDELIGIHPKIKEMLSFKHANNSEIHSFRAKQLIKRWQERPDDHGTPQVQIACMTNRINYLSDHVKKHRKDNEGRMQLRLLISKRQSLLKYIRKKNVPVYYQLIRELDIQDISF